MGSGGRLCLCCWFISRSSMTFTLTWTMPSPDVACLNRLGHDVVYLHDRWHRWWIFRWAIHDAIIPDRAEALLPPRRRPRPRQHVLLLQLLLLMMTMMIMTMPVCCLLPAGCWLLPAACCRLPALDSMPPSSLRPYMTMPFSFGPRHWFHLSWSSTSLSSSSLR